MSPHRSYSVHPGDAFADRLEAMLLDELRGTRPAHDAEAVDRTVVEVVDPTRRGRHRLAAVAAVAAVCVGLVTLTWLLLWRGSTEPVSPVPTTVVTPTSTSLPGPQRVPDGVLAPGEYTVDNFVVPIRFRVADDGWSRLLAQRRTLLLERDDASVALSVGVLQATTPLEVVEYVCPGRIRLDSPTEAMLLGSTASVSVGSVTDDCTIVLCTFVDLRGCRHVLPAGSAVTIASGVLGDEHATVIVSTAATTSSEQLARIEKLWASLSPG